MWSNKYFSYTVYVLAASFLSEVIYRWLRRGKRDKNAIEPINEVLFSNGQMQWSPEEGEWKPFGAAPELGFNKNINRIVELIDGAKYSINLCMYIFTVMEVAEAMNRASRRGVNIRIIGERSMAFSSGSQMRQLHQAGIPVRFPVHSKNLMHHKFCIIDGPQYATKEIAKEIIGRKGAETPRLKSVVLSGSLNWTMQAFCGNWDNIIITSNQDIIRHFEDEFSQMWADFNKGGEFIDDAKMDMPKWLKDDQSAN